MYQTNIHSTQHSPETPHGLETPHKYPVTTQEDLSTILSGLVRQLYPTGRAFLMKKGGYFDKFHQALDLSFVRLIQDGQYTLDGTIPDNPNFDEQDAALWEYRMGMVTNTSLTLEVRKEALYRRMGRSGWQAAKQNPLSIEYQLQLAGFDVFVHENRFYEGGEWVYKTPEEVGGFTSTVSQHGGTSQHGDGFEHGGTSAEIVANSVYPGEAYSVGGYENLYATFFIGGAVLGEPATVDGRREREFRELILKLKPASTAAYIFINYT